MIKKPGRQSKSMAGRQEPEQTRVIMGIRWRGVIRAKKGGSP